LSKVTNECLKIANPIYLQIRGQHRRSPGAFYCRDRALDLSKESGQTFRSVPTWIRQGRSPDGTNSDDLRSPR